MCTSFEPAGRELRAPLAPAASFYSGSAELCAAILSAAESAPEFPPKPYRDTFPAGAYAAGPESRAYDADGAPIVSDGAGVWHEWQGPVIPRPEPRQDARAVFHYRTAHGTRGQVSSAHVWFDFFRGHVMNSVSRLARGLAA